MEVPLSWGAGQLRRDDGLTWSEALRPALDGSAGPHALDRALGWITAELARHPLPEQMITVGGWSLGRKDPVTFASFLTGHRAERLAQVSDLAANALSCLGVGALLPAAASARSALEIAAMCAYADREIDRCWPPAHGSVDRIREAVLGPDAALWNTLVRVRIGTPGDDGDGPRPVPLDDAFRAVALESSQLGLRVSACYDRLCSAVHPGHGVQETMWRVGGEGRLSRRVVLLAPTRSQSPVRVDVVDGIMLAASVVTDFARLLWWAATDVSLAFGFRELPDHRLLGLPIAGAPGAACVCGSGAIAAMCDHPRPRPRA